jgi:hypothetical protein
LIGHLDIQTQFRILGTVFLISLLIAIAAVFMQVPGHQPRHHLPRRSPARSPR